MPILGAVLVNLGKTLFTGALPELWLFALGGLFIFVTLVPAQRHYRPAAAPQGRGGGAPEQPEALAPGEAVAREVTS